MTESRTALAARIRALVEEYFTLPPPPPAPGQARLPLHVPSYGPEEVNEAIASLLSTHVTKGEKARRFEALGAEYPGVAEAVVVTTCSTANRGSVAALATSALPRQ